ncbi:MAG TPA: hypothetical protein VMG60_00375 [Burkholderiaceae bacterium]|nr:hypothetical protein [Burkholderiaceae bacterium]
MIAGPRKGVKGPFIALLRSPELLARLQKVGEYLRLQSALCTRVNEFVTLIVAREWTQEFEWFVARHISVVTRPRQGEMDRQRPGREMR